MMKKKRIKHTKSIIRQEEGTCFLCGDEKRYRHLERHHIFPGTANRKKSEENGLTVRLCKMHHIQVHEEAAAARRLQAYAQSIWEALPGNSREGWMELFGRNYRER